MDNTSEGKLTWTIGERLRIARLIGRTDIDLDQFAKLIGISRNTVRNYEREDTPVTMPVLRSWAVATGYPLEWLISDMRANPGSHPESIGRVMSTDPLDIRHPDDLAVMTSR